MGGACARVPASTRLSKWGHGMPWEIGHRPTHVNHLHHISPHRLTMVSLQETSIYSLLYEMPRYPDTQQTIRKAHTFYSSAHSTSLTVFLRPTAARPVPILPPIPPLLILHLIVLHLIIPHPVTIHFLRSILSAESDPEPATDPSASTPLCSQYRI